MSDLITVQGVVLSAMPIGEYDKRIVLLTRERGKISVFAKGARRPNSPFLAAANPFVFGNFTLYEGRTSYNLNQVSVTYHFVELASDFPGIYYGYYFLEVADYFGHEGTDEREMMNLLYVSVKALLNPHLENRLVRCIYELRTMTVQGLCPELFQCMVCGKEHEETEQVWFSREAHGIVCADCRKGCAEAVPLSEATLYTMQYIVRAPMGRLYTFSVSEEVLWELEKIIHTYTADNTDRKFKSLDILEKML